MCLRQVGGFEKLWKLLETHPPQTDVGKVKGEMVSEALQLTRSSDGV